MGTRFLIQKEWAFSCNVWGKKVDEFVISMVEMEPAHLLVLCDEARQMVKDIAKRSAKGQLTLSATQAQAQPVKALGCCALLKEGHPATHA